VAAGMVYRAKVTRATTKGVWFTINSTFPGVEFGPCDILANFVRLHNKVPPDIIGIADYIQKGDIVLVVDTDSDDFVVVGSIQSGVTPKGNL
jgi:hypothetical protein